MGPVAAAAGMNANHYYKVIDRAYETLCAVCAESPAAIDRVIGVAFEREALGTVAELTALFGPRRDAVLDAIDVLQAIQRVPHHDPVDGRPVFPALALVIHAQVCGAVDRELAAERPARTG